MDKKTAVYICTGCGIGDAMDVEKLIRKWYGRFHHRLDARTTPVLCSPEGAEVIKKDIEEEGVNTIIIAACSQRVNYDVFNFGATRSLKG